ncbi:MAG: type II toxin-antitoxin system HipA family toxin [Bacteroidales bacterium]|nr:type II toxin-antitoxin system HipA family toxin [Bacteroidales bacterium]
MTKTLRVMLWDEEIGRLAWDDRRRLSYFTYNPEFLKKGLDVSPLVAPIKGVRAMAPVWGEEAKIYQKLPAFVADSLPDAWGNLLFDLWRQHNHLSNADITPLDKLSFIGKRGMGALEFLPETSNADKMEKIDIKSLACLAERIFSEREHARIMPQEDITLQSLLTVGTSAGGRQPKAIIAIHKDTGEIRSGQVAGLKDYEYYLLKFGNSQYSSAELEMVYYEMAITAGIQMMPSRLYEVEGSNNFITKRFDRDGERKLHTQTLAAISPDTDSYEGLISVCRKLHLPESDCQEVFRRMVFNILSNNTDDHTKNFSFIMHESGNWRLAPAYDLTYIIDAGGYLPNTGRCMYVRAKLHQISIEDVILFAKDNGIRRPDAIIQSVAQALKQFRSLAQKYNVQERWINTIEQTIFEHLTSWGLAETRKPLFNFRIEGTTFSDVRLEQTYKGNFHLYATVNGKERKFVINKNKPEHEQIQTVGIAGLSETFVKELASKYLL